MEKRFDPSSYERKWQKFWADGSFFVAESGEGVGSESFCILIPPPNVTGKLHIGHALQSTLQDLIVRWKRMQGYNALWLPGTDHAGIATQLMVERQLLEEGTSRVELGRERFLERMWEWKEKFHDNIHRQLELLGASCDWTRERFTLDEGLSRAVREAFVRLYDEGLISRGEYMVNWSPVLQTAISDLEVEMKTVQGKLYHIAYPVAESDEKIVVATTRPETMLGDTAVAMNPEDERYQALAGRYALLPILGRRIPFIADPHVDPEFGTGLVKVTPYHDPNDFEMGQRHGLEGIRVIGFDGRMTEAAGEEFAGLDRFAARQKVVDRLREDGLLTKVEEHTHNVGHSQRGGEPIEPMVSTQWFADVGGMAQRSLQAVEEGDLKLVPESWDKTWEHWLTNIRPWCISRQLWWGHQIPAWYDEAGEVYVARTREEAEEAAGTDRLEQDPDVLDTWFSSGLWPLSTLGWPEETDDLATFYPTDVLVTGFDILFFWVARMVMLGLHFADEVPFRTVHLTGLVRDARGEKMSKTKGNTLDPRDLVEEYGADAVRFTLAALDSPGRDIPLDPERMAGYRAFGNKIWNATRYVLSRVEGAEVRPALDVDGLEAPERWILSRFSKTAAEVNAKFETFRYDEACHRLYHFFWGELCDWYIELTKPALAGDAPRPGVGEVVLSVLERSLRLLHPVMPHLTEELWQRLPGHEGVHPQTLALAPYPGRVEEWEDADLEEGMEALMQVVTRVRTERAERQLSSRAKMVLFVEGGGDEVLQLLQRQIPLVRFLGRLDGLEFETAPKGALRDVVAGVEVGLVIDTGADPQQEEERLRGELRKLEGEIERARGRLDNPQFVNRAPAEIVEGNRQKLAELLDRRQRMLDALGAP